MAVEAGGLTVPAIVPDPAYFADLVPCRAACPVHTDARGYVQALARGDVETAYRIARQPNPLASVCGRICNAPCERHCRRGHLDAPVTIRALKRVACEAAGPETGADLDLSTLYPDAPCRLVYPDKSVAVVGAGPAGLACAHELARWGARVTIFEAREEAGGMLRYGVPAYRLPRDVLAGDVRQIARLGVEFRFRQALGRDFTLASLRADGYQAIFLGIGAQRARTLPLEGNDLDGVVYAVDYLLNIHQGYQLMLGDRVVIIGGGNVAFDVARSVVREPAPIYQPSDAAPPRPPEAPHLDDLRVAFDVARAVRRAGTRTVELYCLERRHEMPADPEEIAQAEEEGITVHPGWGPGALLGEAGHVTGVRLRRVERVFDEAGRFNPAFRTGEDQDVAASGVVLAVGQAVDLACFSTDDGMETTRQGTLAVARDTLETSIPGVYAGGDAAFGPRIAIEAVAEGKRAAAQIAARLGIPTDQAPPEVRVQRYAPYAPWPGYDRTPRATLPVVTVNRRVGLAEVEQVLSPDQAQQQAQRCLGCHVHPVFDSSRCVLCGGCAEICPERCLSFVPADALGLVGEPVGQPVPSPAGTGWTSLVMDETRCIRCGLCAARCPTFAIQMEGFELCH